MGIIPYVTKRQGYLLIFLVAIAGGAWIHWTRVPSDDEVAARIAAHVNFQAPDFSLTTLDGKPVSLSDLRGKVVLINFWATWCPPCRAEMQDLQVAYQEHSDGFVVLGINNAEGDESVRRFVDEFHLTFPILLDRDGAVARKYQMQALPTSFFIDRAGIVHAANVGAMNRAYIEAQITLLEAR